MSRQLLPRSNHDSIRRFTAVSLTTALLLVMLPPSTAAHVALRKYGFSYLSAPGGYLALFRR